MSSHSETIESTDTRRVRLVVDEDCENPRTSQDNLSHVVTVPGSRYVDVDADGGPLSDAWARLMGNYGGHHRGRYSLDEGIRIFERYVRLHGGWSLLDTPNDGATAVWYVLPGEDVSPAHAGELLRAERDDYRAWAQGDCWGYVVEQAATWHRDDDEDETMTTWEETESCWGYIGHQWAEEEARRAFADED